MKAQLREQAIRLRLDKNLGYVSIAKLVPVSKSTLSEWLKNYPLSEGRVQELRRQNLKNNEEKIEKFRAKVRQSKQDSSDSLFTLYKTRFSNISTESKLVAGLMLYLAEGTKSNNYHIALANTNPDVIKFFVWWIGEFLNITKDSLKFELHLYENMDLAKEVKFWKQELGIKDEQFYKHQVRKLNKNSFKYKDSFRHGTCSVRYGSFEKKQELMVAIKALMSSFLK